MECLPVDIRYFLSTVLPSSIELCSVNTLAMSDRQATVCKRQLLLECSLLNIGNCLQLLSHDL